MRNRIEGRAEAIMRMLVSHSGFWATGLLALGLGLTGCTESWHVTGHEPVQSFEQVSGSAGYGGQVVETTEHTNATVTAVDQTSRTLQLRQPDGTMVPFKLSPAVELAKFKTGQKLNLSNNREVAISVSPEGTALSGDDTVTASPETGPPAASLNTRTFVARVVSLDTWNGKVTLKMASGADRTIKVRDSVNLASFNPGDIVSVKVTETVTLQ